MEFSEKLPILEGLVNQFKTNINQYKSLAYDEANTRVDFIDKFFEILDWDVRNLKGYSEDYREVVREDKVVIEGKPKAPDYSFRIGGARKFFVEAKKPSVGIKDNVLSAYQLRRYAYTAKLPLSILTDFEEFAVYDTRIKPAPDDKASIGRVFFCTYEEYKDNFDFIYNTFSLNALNKGSFDQYIIENKNRKGTSEVDKEFLKLIEEWRSELARVIALRNKDIDVFNLNFAVQTIIDRIIFLRIAEDRRMEQYGQLQALLKNDNVYDNLDEIFRKADIKYNSGLFKVEDWISNLEIDDKSLSYIIKGLYYPDCPYELSVLPIEILGQIYEQFLGKTIRLTTGHQAKIEEKPEVRKAGGVYYTPQYVVDYIVEHTVGEKIKDKKPDFISDIKILDPACGSGSFLVGAYHCLLDYHLKYYIEQSKLQKSLKDGKIYQVSVNTYRLSIIEKQRILLNNIFGVDIDNQAVEVTKLSLLLKLMEDENLEGREFLFKHSDLKLLPDLSKNIKWGNSLIAQDFYEDKNLSIFDKEEIRKVNAFNWHKEFSDIFSLGGFDCVIGNPPWGADFTNDMVKYFQNHLKINLSTIDSYIIFLLKSISLLKKFGLLGFIIPDTFMRKDNYIQLRKYLIKNIIINELIETGPVFSQVRDTWCVVTNLSNNIPNKDHRIKHKQISRFIVSAEDRLEQFGKSKWDNIGEVKQISWGNSPNFVLGYLINEQAQSIIFKIQNNRPVLSSLKNLYLISRGEEGSKFNIKESTNGNFQMVIPANINRYQCDSGVKIKSDSLTFTKVKNLYEHPKIWIIRIQKMRWKQRIVSTIDERVNSAGMKTLQIIISVDDDINSLKYLQALMSSKLINFYCINYLADDMNQSYLEKIPIPTIDLLNTIEKDRFNSIVSCVDQMLHVKKEYILANSESDKNIYQQKADIIDKQIDRLVYELYGLNDDEIKIVEDILI